MGLQIPGGKRGKISQKVQGACLKEGYYLKQATSNHMRAAWDKQPDNKQGASWEIFFLLYQTALSYLVED